VVGAVRRRGVMALEEELGGGRRIGCGVGREWGQRVEGQRLSRYCLWSVGD